MVPFNGLGGPWGSPVAFYSRTNSLICKNVFTFKAVTENDSAQTHKTTTEQKQHPMLNKEQNDVSLSQQQEVHIDECAAINEE